MDTDTAGARPRGLTPDMQAQAYQLARTARDAVRQAAQVDALLATTPQVSADVVELVTDAESDLMAATLNTARAARATELDSSSCMFA